MPTVPQKYDRSLLPFHSITTKDVCLSQKVTGPSSLKPRDERSHAGSNPLQYFRAVQKSFKPFSQLEKLYMQIKIEKKSVDSHKNPKAMASNEIGWIDEKNNPETLNFEVASCCGTAAFNLYGVAPTRT